jgi:hypothetical protein
MSRRMLLIGSAFVPTDPPPVDPEDPDPPSSLYPTTSDPIILDARPSGRIIASLTVNTTNPEMGTNYHTIGDAVEAAKVLQDAEIQQTSLAPGEFSTLGSPKGPDYGVDIFVSPGTYTESIGNDGWINLVGTTGDPDDVIIESNITGSGTLHAFGPTYLEGITFKALPNGGTPDTGPKYPIHITTGGPGSVIAVNCKFLSTNPGGAGSAGADSGNDLLIYFYQCEFSHLTTGLMNLHGGPSNDSPVTLIWEDCVNNGDFSYSQSGSATDEVWLLSSTGGSLVTDV